MKLISQDSEKTYKYFWYVKVTAIIKNLNQGSARFFHKGPYSQGGFSATMQLKEFLAHGPYKSRLVVGLDTLAMV